MTKKKNHTLKEQNDSLFEEVIKRNPEANAHTHLKTAMLEGMSPPTFWNRWRTYRADERQENESEGHGGVER